MLLDNVIKVKVSNRTKKFFIEKGYVDKNGYFYVNHIDMNDTNRTKVNCECDYCGVIKNITWSNYIIQMKKTDDNIYCCHKCHFNKTKIVFLKKYGVENVQILESVRDKMKKTNNEKYGFDYASQSNCVKNKMKKTLIERYGVDHPMKNEDIFHKAQMKSYKKIKFGDTELHYQGSYELDFLEYSIGNNIVVENGPTIDYIHDNKKRKYYSDFYLPEYNLIVEIKSTYTLNYDYLENLSKKEYSIKNGYNFLFVIDKNYDNLENIIFNI